MSLIHGQKKMLCQQMNAFHKWRCGLNRIFPETLWKDLCLGVSQQTCQHLFKSFNQRSRPDSDSDAGLRVMNLVRVGAFVEECGSSRPRFL